MSVDESAHDGPLLGYIGKFRDGAREGPVAQLYYEDTEDGRRKADEYARRIDEDGYSVYACIGRLRCKTRNRNNVAALAVIVQDIDLRAIVETREQVLECLRGLPLQPSEIIESGGGIYPVWRLREPLVDDAGMAQAETTMKRLNRLLAGDPMPTHRAALMRYPGTHNTKYGDRRECKVLECSGNECDISEFDDLFDIYCDTPLLHYKEKQPNNTGTGSSNGSDGNKTPVDVAERFAAMGIKKGGENSVHPTQLSCTASLLCNGVTVDWAVQETLEATRKMAASDPRADDWDWAQEEHDILGMCYDWINKKPELHILLPDNLRNKWVADVAAGKRPEIIFSKGRIGWHVRGFEPKKGGTETAGAGAGNAAAGAPSTKRVLVLHPFVPFDPATLTPRAWLYGKHYQRRTVSLTAGPGGMGKSSLEMVELLAMATARNLLGEQPTERLRVWLHNGEDPMEEMLRRLAAVCQHYCIPQEELQGYLWITSGNEFPLRVAKGYSNLEINEGLVRQISNAISENNIDVAAFDPLVTLHSVSEGDPGKMDAVVRLFGGIADERDTSIDLSHHVRKPVAGSDADHELNDIRGVMAITDAVRAARVLNRMNKKDAESAGISDLDRLSHFRVDKAKGNYSPAQAATWRRFVNVTLPNTDDVGVVTPWDFPGQGTPTPAKAAADQKAEQVFLKLLDKFLERGANVSANVGPTYAPAKFEGEQEAMAGKVSKAGLAAAMKRLLDAGRVRSVPTGRSDRSAHRLVPWQGAPE
jgi:RecA-family ATPase